MCVGAYTAAGFVECVLDYIWFVQVHCWVVIWLWIYTVDKTMRPINPTICSWTSRRDERFVDDCFINRTNSLDCSWKPKWLVLILHMILTSYILISRKNGTKKSFSVFLSIILWNLLFSCDTFYIIIFWKENFQEKQTLKKNYVILRIFDKIRSLDLKKSLYYSLIDNKEGLSSRLCILVDHDGKLPQLKIIKSIFSWPRLW